MVTIVSPSKAYISSSKISEIREFLTYNNSSHEFAYKRLISSAWLKDKNPRKWEEACKEAKSKIKITLVFKDSEGFYIRPGSVPYLIEKGIISKTEVVCNIKYPKITKPFEWKNPVHFTLYPYQLESIEGLINEKHGNISLCTSAGKTIIFETITQRLGLKTIIVTPSANIFNSVLNDCLHFFGKDLVGGIGDGKKEYGKQITVAISKSLTLLKEGTPQHEDILKNEVVIADEFHLLPSETLEKVFHGVLKDIPYRFFFTGTLSRGDNATKLLESIGGKTVKVLLTKEAVEKQYVADHEFRIVPAKSQSRVYSEDVIKMKREHALYNPQINQICSKMANVFWDERQESTLILVSELVQIRDICANLTVPFGYAHSCANKRELDALGLAKVDVQDVVEQFNTGKIKVLVATSVLNTGANMFGIKNLIMGQFGSSEIVCKQSLGRALRILSKSKYKDFHKPIEKAIIWDFDVSNIPVLKRQLATRVSYYEDSGVSIVWL